MKERKSDRATYWCAACGDTNVRVTDSRQIEKTSEPIVRRRRVCGTCQHRWSTYEISDVAYNRICEIAVRLKQLFPNIEAFLPPVPGEQDGP